ncbi:MAG: hypothetical protein F4X11_08340 [Acidobacteria bacterium]|nr:hypothetical protein [Acidobacteriota bacterium]
MDDVRAGGQRLRCDARRGGGVPGGARRAERPAGEGGPTVHRTAGEGGSGGRVHAPGVALPVPGGLAGLPAGALPAADDAPVAGRGPGERKDAAPVVDPSGGRARAGAAEGDEPDDRGSTGGIRTGTRFRHRGGTIPGRFPQSSRSGSGRFPY